jgi:hypothetical protein
VSRSDSDWVESQQCWKVLTLWRMRRLDVEVCGWPAVIGLINVDVYSHGADHVAWPWWPLESYSMCLQAAVGTVTAYGIRGY